MQNNNYFQLSTATQYVLHKVKDMSLTERGRPKIKFGEADLACIKALREECDASKPHAGVRTVGYLHITIQTLAQIELQLLSENIENKAYTLPKHLYEKVARLHLEKIGLGLLDTSQRTSGLGVTVYGPSNPFYLH